MMGTGTVPGGVPDNKVIKQPPNPSNFKIVKCKNWETNNSCKYGSVCTFAHGDNELRTKSDNNLQMSENAITMDTGFMPMQGNPYLMQDPSYIYNLMLQQQMYDMQSGGTAPQIPNQQGVFPQQPQQQQGGMGEVNLNDMNNPYFMGMNNMMQPQDPNQMSQMNTMNNMNMSNPNNLNDNMNPNFNNNNMFMGGSQ
eukprot:CAMPEP_0170519614 /NCGR_PEP_ID=MMETSP0209-20121228/4967_1 /TAXON_ID=665100 ORGANISM="Litonotus pictus, Strain P1" /NCGR_SAMPLE_ID=MMETSP0209 /ASSEMBLY_ACC=CAM_ASM_000301 /LENGTH=195 /DNA_ID=CAMNT_0010805551 /DNA_START=141 /DNA_END=728 /DNA_ORIENTATION=+